MGNVMQRCYPTVVILNEVKNLSRGLGDTHASSWQPGSICVSSKAFCFLGIAVGIADGERSFATLRMTVLGMVFPTTRWLWARLVIGLRPIAGHRSLRYDGE
jgi:hypothetical protein